MKHTGIIVGAGIIGSAVAYELARRGVSDLLVLDPDLGGEWSSTERNAGGVRHLWSHRVNIDLARHSLSFFSGIADSIGFQKKGYLWLFSKENHAAGEATLQKALEHGLDYRLWKVSEIQERYSFIDKTDDLAFGLFGAQDGLLNSNALKQYYRQKAMERGVRFEDKAWVTSLQDTPSGAKVDYIPLEPEERAPLLHQTASPKDRPAHTKEADFIVLCAGAWMSVLLKPLIPPLVQPIRRQIAFFKTEGLDLSPYGMVVDTSRVYFHAEGGQVLAGFVKKEEAPGFCFDYDADFFESYIWPGLFERSTHFERLRPVTGWGGLYSYTPDTTGILGAVPGYSHLYEAHSFTGRGVMQSYGVATAMADLILNGRFTTIDGSPLSRNRFKGPRESWLFEELHI